MRGYEGMKRRGEVGRKEERRGGEERWGRKRKEGKGRGEEVM